MKEPPTPRNAEPTLRPSADPTLPPASNEQPALRRIRPSARVPSTIPGSDLLMQDVFPDPPGVGQRVGRYLVTEVLGQGGMGMVLKARDDILQRDVAIKVILPQYLASDSAAGLRFLREAEIVAHLSHPHIVRVLDAGLDGGVAFLAFEYIAGRSFAELRREKVFALSEAIALMLPVFSAVHYSHRLSVVHGDLKPTNLLLSTDHVGRGHPYVLDFGVSFFSGIDTRLDPLHGRVNGTPGYLAPEWLETRSVDPRADVFSLACVFYELLVGRGPFAGAERLSDAVLRAKKRDYVPLSRVATVPPELDQILTDALAPNPAERTASLQDFAQALMPYASAPESRYPEFGS
jgi:eukaryotic-like serine/threonine-protein kinase